MSKRTRLSRPAKRGFTLVELLVVIVIIGMLAGLMLPAIIKVREVAKQTTCLNNQHEIGLAITTYETQKGHYPGFLNPKIGNDTVARCWPKVLLPYLGRDDLWIGGWRTGTPTSAAFWPQIGQLVCPDDTGSLNGNFTGLLSYVVNSNIFQDRSAETSGSGPNDLSAAQIHAPTQTIMLGEKITPDGSSTQAAGPWNTTVANTQLTMTAASWPVAGFTSPTYLSTVLSGSPVATTLGLASNHAGIYVVTFMDGHGTKLSDVADDLSPYRPGP